MAQQYASPTDVNDEVWLERSRAHAPGAVVEGEGVVEEVDAWRVVEQDPAFQELVARKRSFILPATLFFIAYYFALPILNGYFPGLMSTNVVGFINVAYLFALSQFFMAWIIMYLYVRRARVFDGIAQHIVDKYRES